ncbi:MAG: VCBS repeat-containing protein [Flavobacteriales bacterium]|nr:VCBS repeat-containing protein [Flavobacteriales bacterium]
MGQFTLITSEISPYFLGANPGDRVIDLDGDQLPEIIFQNEGTRIAQNLGGGSFAPAVLMSGAVSFYAIADLNYDGYPDLIRGGGEFTEIMVRFNQHDLTFSPSVELHPQTDVWAIHPTDVDNNGLLDLVIGYGNVPNYAVLYDVDSLSYGGFAPIGGAPNTCQHSMTTFLAELNGQPGEELMMLRHEQPTSLSFFPNTNGAFSEPEVHLITPTRNANYGQLADMNGDGLMEFIFASHPAMVILLSPADASYRHFRTYVAGRYFEDYSCEGASPAGILCVDVSGDSGLDLVTGAGIYENAGGFRFVPVLEGVDWEDLTYGYCHFLPFDRDGDPFTDVIITSPASATTLFANPPDTSLVFEQYMGSVAYRVMDLETLDYDGDGDDDVLSVLAWLSSGSVPFGEIKIHRNDGAAMTAVSTQILFDNVVVSSCVLDSDLDGIKDVITIDRLGILQVCKGQAGGGLAAPVVLDTLAGFDPIGLHAYSIDGDTLEDIYLYCKEPCGILPLMHAGADAWVPYSFIPVPDSTYVVGLSPSGTYPIMDLDVADINGNGHPDLFIGTWNGYWLLRDHEPPPPAADVTLELCLTAPPSAIGALYAFQNLFDPGGFVQGGMFDPSQWGVGSHVLYDVPQGLGVCGIDSVQVTLVIQDCTGIHEMAGPRSIRAIPNPTTGDAELRPFTPRMRGMPYTLLNTLGGVVAQGSLVGPNLDLDHLESGVYLLRVEGYPGIRIVVQ